MPPSGDFRFGPWRIDLRSQRLLRDDVAVKIKPRQFHLLVFFVEHAGELLTKARLFETVWQGTNVTDGSLTLAIFRLRTILDKKRPERYIQTVARQGYRFVATLEREAAPRRSDAEVAAQLAPYRALLEGRAALESLDAAEIAQARVKVRDLVAADPDEPSFHVVYANACVLHFEATHTDLNPDIQSLGLAATHSLEATRLADRYAEAWATRGFVLARIGDVAGAIAALKRAVALEPDSWQHRLRSASINWGSARLLDARAALRIFPALPAAHWLAATVFTPRGSLEEAEHEVGCGLAAYDASIAPARFAPIGLSLLEGQLCYARGDRNAAMTALRREVALERCGHIYARESAANAWYTIGAILLLEGDTKAAGAALDEALARAPGHKRARVAREIIAGTAGTSGTPGTSGTGDTSGTAPGSGRGRRRAGPAAAAAAVMSVDDAIACAVKLVLTKDDQAAVAVVVAALAAAPPGSAGWIIPVEPLLGVQRHPALWTPVLDRVRLRAE